MKRLSIGLKLTLSYLIIFAVAQAIFGFGMWVSLQRHLYDIADDALEDQIDDMQHFLLAQRPDASVAKLQEEITETYMLEHEGDYLQVRDEQGDWIYRAAFLEKNRVSVPAVPELQNRLFEDRKIGGRRFRFVNDVVTVNGRHFIVQTGVSESDILGTLQSFRRNLFWWGLVMLLFASGVGLWLSRKALAPVDAITKTARSINAGNLSNRLEQLNSGDELQRLSDTLNEMLTRIEEAFKRVSQFTADASHELRTPISLMRTEAEIALRKSRDIDEYQEALRHILIEAERMTVLIEKLLSVARADAGRETLDARPINLRETVARVISEWRLTVNDHNLSLTEHVMREELFIRGDRSALNRLFNILLDNAVKYTPAPGTIDIRLEANNGGAIFSIADTGIGIREDEHERIFERFYRVDKARSRELGGAGLGLAIARWIVEQHGGSILVKSSLGKGATFVVVLPMYESEETS
jgi:heavy metal sensor kinase